MSLSSDLISQFVKATNDKKESTKETTVYGTTVVYDDDIYVKLDGSELLTPVNTTANVVDGERVTVMIKNHTATITGNITSPSARGKDVEMSVNSLNIKIEGVGDSIDSAVDAANSAANAASNAVNAANDAKRYATDYLELSSSGLEIGASSLNTNVLISPNAIDFRSGDTILASYQSDYIYLGKANRKATIDLADGVARLYNEDDTNDDFSRLVVEADHSINLSAMCGVYNNVSYDTGSIFAYGHMSLNSHNPWEKNIDGSTPDPHASFQVDLETRVSSDTYVNNIYMNEGQVNIKTDCYFDGIEYEANISLSKYGEITLNGHNTYMYGDVNIRDNMVFDNIANIYGRSTSGGIIEAFCAQSASNNVTVGYGVYENASGNTNVYGNNLNLYTNNNVYVRGGELMLPNDMNLNGANTSGTYRQLIGYNSNNNTVIGHGGYSAGVGQTNLYGNKIYFGVKTAGESYKPYHEAGDSLTGEWYGSGFISSSSGKVYFTIPLSKPVIGSPSVSISSVDGLQIRIAAGGYGYGSGASAYAKPSSYTGVVALEGNYIRVTATMGNTTNVTNNTPCGVSASIKITFS